MCSCNCECKPLKEISAHDLKIGQTVRRVKTFLKSNAHEITVIEGKITLANPSYVEVNGHARDRVPLSPANHTYKWYLIEDVPEVKPLAGEFWTVRINATGLEVVALIGGNNSIARTAQRFYYRHEWTPVQKMKVVPDADAA